MSKTLIFNTGNVLKLSLFACVFFLSNLLNAASINFNTAWIGTPTSNSINIVALIPGSGYKFTSANPSDPVFVANGNDIAGIFTYIDASNNVISVNGIISRQNKSGGTTNGLFFYPYSDPTHAYILVVPGRESQYTTGGSYSSSSDTGNTVVAMNEILTTQAALPVMSINSPTVLENASYITFTIVFSNNAIRTAASSFPLYMNNLSASVGSDLSSAMQYSSDGVSWTNYVSSLTYPLAASSMSIRIPILNDTLKECTETFTLEAGTITGGNILNSSGTYGTGTINDEENYYVWVGTTSTSWDDASNWVCNEIPVNGGNVVISSSAVNDCRLISNRTVGYLKFSGSGKKVVLDDDTLFATSISGANSTNHVQTNNVGMLKLQLANNGSGLFPIGNSSYNPVTLTNRSGSSDYFLCRVIDEVYQTGYGGTAISAPRVIRTWDIDKINANGGSGVDFVLNWNNGETSATISNPMFHHHTGTIWEIPLTGSGFYTATTCTYSGYKGTFSPFSVYHDVPVALSGEMGTFSVDCSENIHLKWSTYSEYNLKHFIPELSRDGSEWTSFPAVNAHGNSNTIQYYETTIEYKSLLYGYARLLLVDNDGTIKESSILSVNCDQSNEDEIKVYPNPSEGIVQLAMIADEEEMITISILDVNGISIEEQEFILEPGNNLITLDLSHLSKSNYQLIIKNDTRFVSQRLILL